MTTSIYAKNQNILLDIKRRLAQTEPNLAVFVHAAEELARWLGDAKAYYPVVRTLIVELLETALLSVSRCYRPDVPPVQFQVFRYWRPESLPPMIQSYVRLIQTVSSFRGTFAEKDLRERVDLLLQTISIDDSALHGGITSRSRQGTSPSASITASPITALPTPTVTSPNSPSDFVVLSDSAVSAPPTMNPKLKQKPKIRKSINKGFLDGDLEWFAGQQKSQATTSEAPVDTNANVNTLAATIATTKTDAIPNIPVPDVTDVGSVVNDAVADDSAAKTTLNSVADSMAVDVAAPTLSESLPESISQHVLQTTKPEPVADHLLVENGVEVPKADLVAVSEEWSVSPTVEGQRPLSDFTAGTDTTIVHATAATAIQEASGSDAAQKQKSPLSSKPSSLETAAQVISDASTKNTAPTALAIIEEPSVPSAASTSTSEPSVSSVPVLSTPSLQRSPFTAHSTSSGSPKKRKGRPPGVRALPTPSFDVSTDMQTPPTHETEGPTVTQNGLMEPAPIIGAVTPKKKKKRGRPPGIRSTDMRPTETESAPDKTPDTPATSTSLKIRIPPRSPVKTPSKETVAGPSVVTGSSASHLEPEAITAQLAIQPMPAVMLMPTPSEEDELMPSSPESVDIPLAVNVRKRALSGGANADMPSPQRRRTSGVPAASPVITMVSSPAIKQAAIPAAAEVAMVVDKEATSAALAPDVAMNGNKEIIPTAPSAESALPPQKPVLHLLSQIMDGKEDGEVTPSPAATPLPQPAEAGEVRAESSLPSIPPVPHVNGDVRLASPTAVLNGDAMSASTSPPPEQSMAVDEASASPLEPTQSSERAPLGVFSTNVPRATGPAYGPSVQIMSIVWGSNKSTTSDLEFTLGHEDIEQLMRWASRSEKTNDDLSDSKSLTLATYRAEELYDILSRCGQVIPEELTKISPVSWQAAYLYCQVNEGHSISLCPPSYSFAANENHIVDLATNVGGHLGVPTLREGLNCVKLVQQGRLSQYAWVLTLNSPSSAQLSVIQARRDYESKWTGFIAGLRIMKIPSVTFPPIVSS